MTNPSAAPAPDVPLPVAVSSPRSRTPLYLVLLLAAAWICGLALLTWTSSNPITVNSKQIADSAIVVVGRIADLRRGRVTEVTLRRGALSIPSEIHVSNLPETGARQGGTYILPLVRAQADNGLDTSDFRVTPSHLPGGIPLVYPATPEALRQLDRIAGEVRPGSGQPPIPPGPHN